MLAAAAAASVSREVGLARRSGGGLRPGVSADDLRIVVGPANGGATQTQAARSVVHSRKNSHEPVTGAHRQTNRGTTPSAHSGTPHSAPEAEGPT